VKTEVIAEPRRDAGTTPARIENLADRSDAPGFSDTRGAATDTRAFGEPRRSGWKSGKPTRLAFPFRGAGTTHEVFQGPVAIPALQE